MPSLRHEETDNPFVFPVIITFLIIAAATVFYLGSIDKPVEHVETTTHGVP